MTKTNEHVILIITAEPDAHVSAVVDLLKAQGVAFIVWDPGSFPSASTIVMSVRSEGSDVSFSLQDGHRVCTKDITCIWYRRPSRATPLSSLDTRVSEYVTRDSEGFLQDFYDCFSGRWIPGPPWILAKAAHKLSALILASKLGFTIPPTVAGNDPDCVCDLFNEFEGRIISKRVGAPMLRAIQDDFVRYTEFVTTNDMNAVSTVQYCPSIFQKYVDKTVEIRVTVVGHTAFAAEIGSQATAHTRYDWRKFDDYATPYKSHNIPTKILDKCIHMTHTLGLTFSAIDLIVDRNGNYVFVELNPNGQYLWIEEFTGLPISTAVANLLIRAQ